MTSRARGTVFGLALAVLVVFAAERQLDDGMSVLAGHDPVPPLWQEASHGSTEADPSAGRAGPDCVLVTSLDLRSPFTFTSADKGVQFDIDGDGDGDRVSWTEPGSDVAFLAVDADNDGAITSGKELIGRVAVSGAGSAANALIAMAKNADRGQVPAALDSSHPLFQRVLLWLDFNHDGVSEPDELEPASDSVADIALGFRRQHRRDQFGNESRTRGSLHVRTATGLNSVVSAADDLNRVRPVYDACLVVAP
jgi:hypothetical protein